MSDLFLIGLDDNDDDSKLDTELTELTELTSELQDKLTMFPSYPFCDKLRGNNSNNAICCLDILKELEFTSSKQHSKTKVRKCGIATTVYPVTHVWHDGGWHAEQHDAVTMVSIELLQCFLEKTLKRSRKSTRDKHRLMGKFGLTTAMKGPIETDVLELLIECSPPEIQIQTQYRIGKYRLDAYIANGHLGIEIDEHGHGSYDKEEEELREKVIKQHGIECIRFNPHAYQYPARSLVALVWSRMLAPEFSSTE